MDVRGLGYIGIDVADVDAWREPEGGDFPHPSLRVSDQGFETAMDGGAPPPSLDRVAASPQLNGDVEGLLECEGGKGTDDDGESARYRLRTHI